MYVRTYMTRYPITISREISVVEALETMRKHKVRKLPVVTDKKLIGLVTEQDLLKVAPSPATTLSIYEQNYLLRNMPVKEAMVKDPVTISPEATIEEAALVMHDRKISCLLVMENGELVGILTQTDLFEAMIQISGLRRAGSRLVIEAEDRIGLLWEITGLIKEEGINIISAVLQPNSEQKIDIMLRLNTADATSLVQQLTTKGYLVKSVL